MQIFGNNPKFRSFLKVICSNRIGGRMPCDPPQLFLGHLTCSLINPFGCVLAWSRSGSRCWPSRLLNQLGLFAIPAIRRAQWMLFDGCLSILSASPLSFWVHSLSPASVTRSVCATQWAILARLQLFPLWTQLLQNDCNPQQGSALKEQGPELACQNSTILPVMHDRLPVGPVWLASRRARTCRNGWRVIDSVVYTAPNPPNRK